MLKLLYNERRMANERTDLMKHEDILYLGVPLPEDIRRLKDVGDFARMERVINMRLKQNIPRALKTRLALELDMCALLPGAYPYTRAQAEAMLTQEIRDFAPSELDLWRDMDAADWIFINGEERYRRNFLSNLIKTRPSIAARVIDPRLTDYSAKNAALLDRAIDIMREKGELAVKMRIRASISIRAAGRRPGKLIRAYIPLPIAGAQAQNIEIHALSEQLLHVSDETYPQRTACFEAIYAPGMEFFCEYSLVNRVKYIKPDPEKVMASQPKFYTEEIPPHARFTPYLRALAEEIVGAEQNPLLKARKIYDWLTTAPIYSFMPPYFTLDDIPGYMATRLKGDCGVFALLFITLLRISGVPARWQSGLYATPLEIGDHDWAQFYVAPYGWLFADCSFGNTAHHHASQTRREFYFGNLDPYRVPTTSEFQHEFDPPMRFMRYDPYDNQEGEAEYADMPINSAHISTKQEMIEIAEV